MDEQKPSKIGTKEYIIDKISKITTQEQLHTVTGIAERRPPAWRRFFVENWVYKVTAVIFTLMLFYIVNIDKAKDAALDLNVVTSYLPKDMIITNIDDIPKKLHLKIRGRWSDLAKALQKPLTPYRLDMRGYVDGTQVIFSMSTIKKIIGVPGITIQSVSPSIFIVRVAPRGEKNVMVEPRLVGKLPKGYKLDNNGIVVSPPKIKIWGVRSTIEKTEHLYTKPIDLSKINKSTVLDVVIMEPDTAISVSMNKKTVKVNIHVKAIMGKRRFTNVVVKIKDCPKGYSCIVNPQKVRVDLKGPEPDLLALDSHKFAGGVSIDATDLDVSQSVYRVSPNCERPASISCRLHPRSVKLRFVKKPTEVSVGTNGPKGQPKLHKKSVKKNNRKNSKKNAK